MQPVIYRLKTAKQLSYIVRIQSIDWSFVNATQAVDVCFKAMSVMHLHYPYESANIWMFIQRKLYDITTEFDFTSPGLELALKEITI